MTTLNVTINGKDYDIDFLPCPFCGSNHLGTTEWWDDDGEYAAIACGFCKAEAPAESWNTRAAA